MKWNHLPIFLFFIFLFISEFKCENSNFNLEELLNASNQDQNTFETDSDDLVLKMKNFFDTYANKLKNSINVVDKLSLPDQKTEYIKNFSIEDLNRQASNFIDESNQMREKDLKGMREVKQNVEEKYIDLITKNKILKSRMNIGSGEKNKNFNDLNEKNNLKMAYESEIKEKKLKSEELIKDDVVKIKNLRNDLKDYDEKIKHLKLDKKIFEDEMAVQNNLEEYKTKIFKSDFESEFYVNQNATKSEFISKAKQLESLFLNGVHHMKHKIQQAENRIQNKTETLNKIRKEIQNKYEVFDNLNNTIHKLRNIQGEYKTALGEVEESINMLKSKKMIITENIAEKNKQRAIRKQTIEEVLHNLEKKLDNYNVDKINVNKYRRDITNINNRIRNLLSKENMIFKKNKIKI